MGFLDRFRRTSRQDVAAVPLYQAVVARARQPHWYLDGAVPDTLDGRFDMVAAVTAFVLMRIEDEPAAAQRVADLTERVSGDREAQSRQIGFGDMVVGKQVGRMMGMLGGRLGAYRTGSSEDVDEAIRLHKPLEAFLGQGKDEATGLMEGYQQLAQILQSLATER